jgi:peptide deformylase
MKRNKVLIIAIYVLFIVSFLSVSYTLGKYVSNQSVGGSFEIGDQLYFKYSRSDLFRNDQLIVGVIETDPDTNKTYITTDNVSPGDNVRYHFYISNFDLETGKTNGYDANFLPVSTALLNMPIKGSSFDLDATIYYRVIPLAENGEPDPTNPPSTVYNIVTKEDKLLRKKSQAVPEITPNVIKLLDRMQETMYAAHGVGLAAPQVGILKRVVVIDVGEEGPGVLRLINPEILERSGVQNGPEGCLSCPGMYGDVKRSQYVKVKALNEQGEEMIIEAEDFLARALQHEIDHLEGILFIDTATNLEYEK